MNDILTYRIPPRAKAKIASSLVECTPDTEEPNIELFIDGLETKLYTSNRPCSAVSKCVHTWLIDAQTVNLAALARSESHLAISRQRVNS